MPEHRPPALLLLGPTGSGKTPLGLLLESRGLAGHRCQHFDFGEELRQVVARNQPDAIVSREDIDFLRHVLQTGALLEEEQFPIAARILRSCLAGCVGGGDPWIVLNGLPRHASQALAMAEILDVRAVVFLCCSLDDVLARIENDAGGDRQGRSDDDLDTVRRKLAIFSDRSRPLLDFYRLRGAAVIDLDVASTSTAEDTWRSLEAAWRGHLVGLAEPEIST